MIKLQELVRIALLQDALSALLLVLAAYLLLTFFKRWLRKLGHGSGILFSVVKILVWFAVVLVILGNLGYDVTSLVAGLGITGIALALAAQETLSNAFGSLAILADKPFRVGDTIRLDQFEGKVLAIGIRSTKLQTKTGVISIPNKMVAALPIENLKE